MSHFFAEWDHTTYPHILRKDTRIFWNARSHNQAGTCVGSFVGENPGKAKAKGQSSGWSELVTGAREGDQTLRFLLEVWKKAVNLKGSTPEDSDYIEVLNTYYFRCPKSMVALDDWRRYGGNSIYFQSPSRTSRFVILGWGKEINNQPEAQRIAVAIACHPVIYADHKGFVPPFLVPPFVLPRGEYPAQPSGIARKGHERAFLKNLSFALQPFV